MEKNRKTDNCRIAEVVFSFTILLLALLLCSCQKDERVMPSDNAKLVTSSGFFDNFFETEDGCYSLNCKLNPNCPGLICFCSKGTYDWTPLCNKPNCKHNSIDCNAYCGAFSMSFFDGYIYSVDGTCIIRRNPDGNNHLTVCDAPFVTSLISSGGKQMGGFFRFVDGYLLNFIQQQIDIHKNITKFCRVDLKTGEQKWMFESDIGDAVLATPSYAANGEVLFTYSSVNTRKSYFASGNYLTGSLNWVIPDWDTTSHGNVSVYQGEYVFYKSGKGFYSLDAESGTENCIVSEKYCYMFPYYTDSGIICTATTSPAYSDIYLVVYDSDFNKINEFELDTSAFPKVPIGFPVYLYAISSDALWFSLSQMNCVSITHYIPRSEIYSGSPKLREVKNY